MKLTLKQIVPYVSAVALFLIISVGYFSPAIFQNKALNQHDIRKGIASSVDLVEHQKETGEKSLWASRMFSGMPSYQIAPTYKTSGVQQQMRSAFELWLPSPASHLFAYMLGFFLLLLALRVNPWIAMVGAVAFAFSTYYLIIIAAGHIWKVRVIELIPPTLAGIIWTYRGKYIWGGLVTAYFFCLQLFSNHLQMTYYFMLFVGIFFIARFIHDFRKKNLKGFAKATGILAIAAAIGVGANITNLVLTESHTSQTIRGGSELTSNAEDKTAGLDRSYVTAWSYGIGETFSLLIPNTKGGASGYIQDLYPKAVNEAKPEFRQAVAQQNAYWGDQPGTSGPVYVGAFIMFLFIFGLFVVKGYMKWTLLIATIFSVLLSWGHNFMWFTNLFLDYFPYYNKMRSVSSILIVAEFCIPLLAILALAKIVKKPAIVKENKLGLYVSLGLTAGLAILFMIIPKAFFSFLSTGEAGAFAEYAKQDAMYAMFRDNLVDVRVSIFRADALRSLLFIALGVGAVLFYWYQSAKLKAAQSISILKGLFVAFIMLITLIDFIPVNKRYLNNDNFVPKSRTKVTWDMTYADKYILEQENGKDPNYRVLNLSVSTFNDASTSYYHKSLGGYHGAKLRRYQDIIERYFSTQLNPAVLNMLNTRYVISGEGQPMFNADALGHAWFVSSIDWVNNADEEIAALEGLDPAKVAVIDKRFTAQLDGFIPQADSLASIVLDKYQINDITYKSNSKVEQLAVFPEIYYDDGLTRWQAFIDGQEVPVVRANYILRAVRIPAGEHAVQLVFKPAAYGKLETISVASLILLFVAIGGGVVLFIIRRKKVDQAAGENKANLED